MNRRDALKSLLAAPVAAALPVEPQKFDLQALLNSHEWKTPVLLEALNPRRAGEETIILEYQRFDPRYPEEFGQRTYHALAHIAKGGTTGLRIPFLDKKGQFGVRSLTDSGRRDPKGRRIFA